MIIIQNFSVLIEHATIINNLSLSCAAGTIHALMGPNGSGKSSFALSIAGHPHYKTEGSVIVHGESILDKTPDQRSKMGIFLAFQYPLEIPGLNVFTFLKELYNLHNQKKVDVAEFQSLLLLLMDRLAIEPTFIERNVNEGFSGGQKKRFEILQLLLIKPSVAIFDEIDSGLDVDALKIVANGILFAKECNPNLVIIMITHYQRILQYIKPDFIHIMQKGAIVHSGTHELADSIEQKGYACYE